MIYAAIILVVLLMVLIFFLGNYAFNNMTKQKRLTLDECFDLLEKDKLYSREEFEKLQKEELSIKTTDGLILRGTYIEKFKDSKKVIIVVHGYKAAFPWSLQFLNMFLNEGFNVLLVDQRSHGRSEGEFATYGYYEKYDLDLWVNLMRKRIGDDAVIGLHGQSMGGGTVLEYAAINKHVSFIIADCPYSDVKKLMKHQFNNLKHLPVFPILNVANIELKMKAKFSVKDVSPINSIKDKDIPVLFIHGSKDNFVPTYMSEEMYNVKKGYKKLLIVEDAFHANAYGTNRELYEKEVKDFLAEVL